MGDQDTDGLGAELQKRTHLEPQASLGRAEEACANNGVIGESQW